MRAPVKRPNIAKYQSFPAPVGGWIANENLAVPNARRADGSRVNGAVVLENWFPTATGIRIRKGSENYATLGEGEEAVTSAFTYINGNNRKLFATTRTAIFDITNVVAPDGFTLVDDLGNDIIDDGGDLIGQIASEEQVSSLSGGDWSVVQFATSGGVYLRAVNGVDAPLAYDGAAWDTSPALTGPADPSDLSYVWVYKQRMFFVERDTLDAWYLAVDTLGGAATKLPLGGVFGRGGSLLFGATWSLDTGAGLSEQCVFVSTEGEVAVYQGTNPGDASEWSKVGVYRIGKPRGPKAFIRAGGDLIIATDIGFVPLSSAVNRDFAALAPVAVSYPIEDAWNRIVASNSFANWHCEIWPTKQMVVISIPARDGEQPIMLVANARTGAWAPFTGWRSTCLVLFGDRFFFGSTKGKVVEAEVTGADQGQPYTAVCVPLFDPLKTPASLKTGLLARATIRASAKREVRMTLQHDYKVSLPAAPNDTTAPSGSLWGVGIWGQATWGATTERNTYQDWMSVPGSGYALSVSTQITSGSIVPPDEELIQTDLTYEIADVVS